jgi:hypothetical protein
MAPGAGAPGGLARGDLAKLSGKGVDLTSPPSLAAPGKEGSLLAKAVVV